MRPWEGGREGGRGRRCSDSPAVGASVGAEVGRAEGDGEGGAVGVAVGVAVGLAVGSVGLAVGMVVGTELGIACPLTPFSPSMHVSTSANSIKRDPLIFSAICLP